MEESAHGKSSGIAAAADKNDVSVTLICKDGKEVEAPKKDLISLSPVFETLLTNEWKEGQERRVSVNWDSELVETIVSLALEGFEKFGECVELEPLAKFMDFLEFAVYYNSKGLLNCCCKTLTSRRETLLTGVNFFEIYEVANDNDVFGIVHECLTMFRMRIFDFVVVDGFAEAFYRFMERGRKDKGVHRLITYIEKYKEFGTQQMGEFAMPISPCSGCPNCKALPRIE